MGPEVGPAFQRLSGCTLFSSLGVRLAGTVSRHRPGNSALRVAIQTAARARSGRANDMGGIRDVRLAETSARLFDPESFVTESRSATCDRLMWCGKPWLPPSGQPAQQDLRKGRAEGATNCDDLPHHSKDCHRFRAIPNFWRARFAWFQESAAGSGGVGRQGGGQGLPDSVPVSDPLLDAHFAALDASHPVHRCKRNKNVVLIKQFRKTIPIPWRKYNDERDIIPKQPAHCAALRRSAPRCTAQRRTSPHRTAPHRTARAALYSKTLYCTSWDIMWHRTTSCDSSIPIQSCDNTCHHHVTPFAICVVHTNLRATFVPSCDSVQNESATLASAGGAWHYRATMACAACCISGIV
eukprot:gene16947-biopygen8289